MCGIAGELGTRTCRTAASPGSPRRWPRAARTAPACTPPASIALGHRRLKIIDLSERGAQPIVDSELGLSAVFNGCIYNYRELRAELDGPRLPVLLHLRHRGAGQGVPPLGRRVRRALPGHVRVRGRRAGHRRAHPRPGPAGHQAAVPVRDAGAAALRLVAARAAGRRRRRHRPGPGRAAPLHDVPLGGAGAAHHPGRDPQAAPGHRAHRPARRHQQRARLLAARARAPAGARRDERAPTGATPPWRRCGWRCAGGWSPTCRSACCCPAGWTRRWSSRCWRTRARSG